MEITNSTFRQQIKDDIELIRKKIFDMDEDVKKPEYAFNYWILSEIYNLDEAVAVDRNVTEYNDKGVDCFVHYEESKELYIIQNKYYGENTNLNRKEVNDFLGTPLATLKEGKYTRSPDLQQIFKNAIKKDSGYRIFLHFYVTNDKKSDTIARLVENFNEKYSDIRASISYLSDIKDMYYGKEYKDKKSLECELSLEGGVSLMETPFGKSKIKAFYTIAKVSEIYTLSKDAEKKDYPLFEENIREYLGGTGRINKGIVETLIKEQNKFLYYNNGITITCEAAVESSAGIKLKNPKIVNGCQTVSSIAEVLNRGGSKEKYEKVHVATKILVVKGEGKTNQFHKDIVLYSNSQNSINEKAFGAADKIFGKTQKGIKKWGFLLCVKPSDKHVFKEYYSLNKPKGNLLRVAKGVAGDFYPIKNITDVLIGLEHLLQIIKAFSESAHSAYIKKTLMLRKDSEDYVNFSLNINERFTFKQMVILIILYKRAESDKRKSDNNRTPVPYYLLNFLGFHLKRKEVDLGIFLERVTIEQLKMVYRIFKPLSTDYSEKYLAQEGEDYNKMIKKPMDEPIMEEILDSTFKAIERHNVKDHEEFTKMIEGFKS